MKSAPAWTVAATAILLCTAALAQEPPPGGRQDPEARWEACRALPDPAERAACYEKWHDDLMAHRPPRPGGPRGDDQPPGPPR